MKNIIFFLIGFVFLLAYHNAVVKTESLRFYKAGCYHGVKVTSDALDKSAVVPNVSRVLKVETEVFMREVKTGCEHK